MIDDDDERQQPEGQPADAPERGGGPGEPAAVQQEAAVAPVLVVCQDTFTAGQVRCGVGQSARVEVCRNGHALCERDARHGFWMRPGHAL